MTFWPRLTGETGATPEELTRANFVAREIFGSLPLREEIKTFDNTLDASTQTLMRIEMRTLVERASRWLVNNRRPPLDSQGTVDYFSATGRPADGRAAVAADRSRARAPTSGRNATLVDQRRARGPRRAASRSCTRRTCCSASSRSPTGCRSTRSRSPALHFALGERLGLPDLVTRILALPRDDRWQTMARAALRDDVYAVHAQLTAQVLRDTAADGHGAGPDRGVGGRRRRRGPAGGRRPCEEICAGRQRRPGPDVGRSARGPRAARQLSRVRRRGPERVPGCKTHSGQSRRTKGFVVCRCPGLESTNDAILIPTATRRPACTRSGAYAATSGPTSRRWSSCW